MSKNPPRVFIDTNIWFSAFYGSENCEKLLTAHLMDKIEIIISQQVIEEIVRNIKEKIPGLLPLIKNYFLNSSLEIITNPKNIPSKIAKLVALEDQPIFMSAVMGKADIFVTGNTKDFKAKKLKKITGIKIFNPKQTVEILEL